MDNETKQKSVNMEDMQAHTRSLHNKGIGNSGTCPTAAGTAEKAVTLGTTFSLVTGATILVTFTNAISVAGATLAVTHTPLGASEATTEAAKPIYYRGAALAADMVKAGDSILMRYNGTQFDILGTLDTDTNTVTDLSYDSYTGKLQKTVNGETSDVVTIVNSGFRITEDDTNGIDELTAIGSATIVEDNTNGIDELNF